MTIPSDNEVGNLWSPRQQGILGWGAGEGGLPSQEGGTGSKGGGEAEAEMISFLKPGSSQWAGEKMMSSPPPPPPSSLGSPTENSRQVLSCSCIAGREKGWGWLWGRARDLPDPVDGPRRQDSAHRGSPIKMSSAWALPALQHNDFFGEKEKNPKIYFAATPPPPLEEKNQPTQVVNEASADRPPPTNQA